MHAAPARERAASDASQDSGSDRSSDSGYGSGGYQGSYSPCVNATQWCSNSTVHPSERAITPINDNVVKELERPLDQPFPGLEDTHWKKLNIEARHSEYLHKEIWVMPPPAPGSAAPFAGFNPRYYREKVIFNFATQKWIPNPYNWVESGTRSVCVSSEPSLPGYWCITALLPGSITPDNPEGQEGDYMFQWIPERQLWCCEYHGIGFWENVEVESGKASPVYGADEDAYQKAKKEGRVPDYQWIYGDLPNLDLLLKGPERATHPKLRVAGPYWRRCSQEWYREYTFREQQESAEKQRMEFMKKLSIIYARKLRKIEQDALRPKLRQSGHKSKFSGAQNQIQTPQEPQEAGSKVSEQHSETDVKPPEQQEATQQTTDDDVDEELVQTYMRQYKTVPKMKTYIAERGLEILPTFSKKRDMAVALVKDDKARQAKREGKKPQLSAQLPCEAETASRTQSPQDASAQFPQDVTATIHDQKDAASTPQEAAAQTPQDVPEPIQEVVEVKPTPPAASATQASGKPLSKKQLRNQKKAEKKGAAKTGKASGKKN